MDTVVTGVDDDFIASNRFQMKLAAPEYTTESGVDHPAVWRDLMEKPGLAVVNALLVPTRNTFNFGVGSEDFSLQGVEGLFLENETMDPVGITVLDLKSGSTFELTVVGVLDDFASNGTLPFGIFTSTNTLRSSLPREIDATQFFFKVNPGTQDPAEKVEAALFQHGLQAIDAAETIDDLQGAQRSFFNLVIAFMTLGLVVGIAALGVISARAVVEAAPRNWRDESNWVLSGHGPDDLLGGVLFHCRTGHRAWVGPGIGNLGQHSQRHQHG